MNQKTCKALRKQAHELTIGMPERALVRVGASLVNAKKTTRGTYRYLKAMNNHG